MTRPYALTTHDGKRVDWLTKAALVETEGRLGYDLSIVQGSYNAGGVKASAGTHDGGGVVDLLAWDHVRKVRELRRTGFAAWYRPAIPGLWGAHIHAVLIGNRKLSGSARDQVREYLAGYDGLAGDGRDRGPRRFTDHRFRWRTGAGRINRARRLITRALGWLDRDKIRGYGGIAKARHRLRVARGRLPKT